MIKKCCLVLLSMVLFLSACSTPKPPSRVHQKPRVVKSMPTRAPSYEQPLKSILSGLNEFSAIGCIKNNMLTYLGIPPQFITQIELTDHSNIVILRNPYSNSEGIYVRIAKNDRNTSVLELYKNNIQFVSNRWYQLLDICK